MNFSSRIRKIESFVEVKVGGRAPVIWWGRLVVSMKKWKWGDASTFPSTYIFFLGPMPDDEWYQDYCFA